MKKLLIHLEKNEEIILSEKNENVSASSEIPYLICFPLFIGSIVFLTGQLFYIDNIFQKIFNILMLPSLIYLMFTQIKSFFTKIYLTNKKIMVKIFCKIYEYPFNNICKIKATKENYLILTVKTGKKYKTFLSKIDANLFKEKFLDLYPNYKEEQEEKNKTNFFINFICIIYAIIVLFLMVQIKISEQTTKNKTVYEYSKIIKEENTREWVYHIFSEILQNIELQDSDKPLKVIVDFYVENDSKLQKAEIVQHSFNQKFDNNALIAVQNSFSEKHPIPENIKKYMPVKMRINIVHKGTNEKDLRKNYYFWLEIFGPHRVKPYTGIELKSVTQVISDN